MLVDLLIQAELLFPIDKTRLGNWGNVDAEFKNLVFDPGRRYSVPYTYGARAVGFRQSAIQSPPTQLADKFLNTRYSGRLAIPNDSIVVMQLALK